MQTPLPSDERDALDLEQHVLGQTGHFDTRPGRLVRAKEFGIYPVDRREVIHVLEKHL